MIKSQYFTAVNENQKPPNVARIIVPVSCILYTLSESIFFQLNIFFVKSPIIINPMALNSILYIVAVIVGTVCKAGFIITIEYAVHPKDNMANIIPIIVVLDLSLFISFIGKINKLSPLKVKIMPIQAIKVGISPRNSSPNIPVNKSGPTKSINDNTIGDNLFKDAKNKLSPIAIPMSPLIAIGNIYSLFTNTSFVVNNIADSKNKVLKQDFTVVSPIGSNRSPIFFRIIVHNAHDAVEIRAKIIPDIEFSICYFLVLLIFL